MNNKKVILGGTFDVFHKGHQSLLNKAFSLGAVTIGLTSDNLAWKLKKRKVNKFSYRKEEIENFIKEKFKKEFKIIKIEDKFGPTLKSRFDYIVVSPETYSTAILINEKRKQLKKQPIKIIKIKFVLGRDGKPISSTNLRAAALKR